MNICLLTHYFWPEVGAPQVIHAEWIKRFVAWGHNVKVVTCFPNYPDGVVPDAYRGKAFYREEKDGAEILRTATYAAPNSGFARRLANHLSLTASSWLAFPKLGDIDVIVTEYPPLFTSFSGLAMARLKGIPHVLNAGDLWVEVAIELGMLKSGPAAQASLSLSTAVERMSDRVVVTSAGCIDKLAAAGVPREKVAYLPNSVDVEGFTPDADRRRRVRAERGWDNQVIALYHGTHGLAQGLVQVVETAALLRDHPTLRFVLLGSGAEKELVRSRVKELGLTNVTLEDPRPFGEMPGIVDAADIGLVPLRDIPMFKITLPSKMFEFMAMGKPVALAVDGDARVIIEDGKAGIASPPENPARYADVLRKLADDEALRQVLGENGRKLAVARYSRDRFARDLEALLAQVVNERRGAASGVRSHA